MIRRAFLTALMLGAGLAPASAQDIRELLAALDWDRLAAKATERVTVDLDSSMLKLASGFLSSSKPEEARTRELVKGLSHIWVRSLEFDKPGEYDLAAIDKALASFRGPDWKKIVDVNGKQERAGVYLRSDGDRILGIVVVAAEPEELTVVQIAGSLNPEDLKMLGGQFGIPKMELDMRPRRGGRPAKNE